MRIVVSLLGPVMLAVLLWTVSSAGATTDSSAACRVGTKRAIIGGKVKCLRAGQSCTARYQTAYKRYGFTCVKGHLRKRAAPPTAPPPESCKTKTPSGSFEAPQVGLEPTTLRLTAGCSAN